MADQWHVARGKAKEGPFSLEQMKRMASEGQLLPTDMILKVGSQKWTAASTIDGLFGVQPRTEGADDKQAAVPVEPTLQENPLEWVQEQFRTNPQRVLLAGGGAALVLLFVVCIGCVGIVSQMSGGGDRTGEQAQNKSGGSNDDELTKKVTAQMRKVNADNARKIRRGMTESEVEAILGKSYEKTNDVGVGYTKTYRGFGQSQIIVAYTGGRVDRANWIPPH